MKNKLDEFIKSIHLAPDKKDTLNKKIEAALKEEFDRGRKEGIEINFQTLEAWEEHDNEDRGTIPA